MDNNVRFFSYTAGAIEACSNIEMKSWRDSIAEKLQSKDLFIYDPVKFEAEKVGKSSGEQVKYIIGLKQAGLWKKFYTEMWKIWFGARTIVWQYFILWLFLFIRIDYLLFKNYKTDFTRIGDYEAVLRSSFLIVYMPKDIKTIGTIYEMVIAFLFRIPIYLILPDCSKKDTNSSLIFGVQISGGEIFYSEFDCVKFIKEKYQLKDPPIIDDKKNIET